MSTPIGVKGGHFTGFIYTVLRRHICDQINDRLFYQIPRKQGNSVETGNFCGSARNSAARRKLWVLLISNY